MLINHSGKIYGKWTLINRVPSISNKKHVYNCKCECGTINQISYYNLMHNISLGCKKCTAKLGKNSKRWNGFGDISGDYWYTISHNNLRRAKKLEFNITKEQAWNLFLMQNRKCALTGLDLIINFRENNHNASLDRIDSDKGYVINNIQWVHKDINMMKNEYGEKYFIYMCQLVNQYNRV